MNMIIKIRKIIEIHFTDYRLLLIEDCVSKVKKLYEENITIHFVDLDRKTQY